MSVCHDLSRVSWKLSCTVLRGGTNGNVGSPLDKEVERVDPSTGEVKKAKQPKQPKQPKAERAVAEDPEPADEE